MKWPGWNPHLPRGKHSARPIENMGTTDMPQEVAWVMGSPHPPGKDSPSSMTLPPCKGLRAPAPLGECHPRPSLWAHVTRS